MTSRSWLDRLRGAALVVITIAAGIAVWRNWHAVREDLLSIPPGLIVLAALGAVSSPPLALMAWRTLLRDLGSPLAPGPSAAVFMVGQLGKYLPGSIWTVVAQTEIGSRLGIPRRRLGIVGILLLILTLLTGVLIGAPAVPALLNAGLSTSHVATVVTVGGLLAILLLPSVLNRMIAWLFKFLRRPPLEHPLRGRSIAVAAAWTAAAWLASSLSVWVIAVHLAQPGVDQGRIAVLSTSGMCLATVAGMVSFVVPAGIGVREALLALLLASVMSPSAAVTTVVVSRALSVASDVLWAGAGWAWARQRQLLPPTPRRGHP